MIQGQRTPEGDLSQILEEYLRLGFDFQITLLPLLQEYWRGIFREKLVTMDLLGEDHLVMFYPI